MFRNYLRVALRTLVRNKFSAAINIGGLAIGMSVAILIGLWIYQQEAYNTSFPNHSRIAAVMQNQTMSGNVVTWWDEARQLAPVLRKDYPNLFKHAITVAGPTNLPVSQGNTRLIIKGVYVDPGIIDMLSLDFQKGDTSALRDESSIILSASTAKNIFGTENPMGKTLKINNTQLLTVKAVYADLPENSDFSGFNCLIPFDYLVHHDSTIAKLHWGNSWFRTYVQVNDRIPMAAASQAIKTVKAKYDAGDIASKPELFLHPLNRWHLYSEFKQGAVAGGFIQYVRLFTIIGIFVLLLACINFMNLSTARSEKRAREVGIRKAIGSLRGQLIQQFYGESMLVSLIAFGLAIGIAQLLLPFFSSLAGWKMTIPYSAPIFWMAGLIFVFITGLLAGSYPALYLSSFRPVKVLKGNRGNRRLRTSPSQWLGRSFTRSGPLAALPRKALVVTQFTVSVILIIGTIAVFHQIQYVKDRPVGYDRGGLVSVPMSNDNIRGHVDAIRTQLKQTGLIDEAAASMLSVVNNYATNMSYGWPGKDPSMAPEIGFNIVTPEFGKTIGWQLVAGRDFSRDLATDKQCFVINEAAVRYMGLKHPVGTVMTWNGDPYTIIGVVKDMITQSPFEPSRQMIFSLDHGKDGQIVNIRVDPRAGMTQALAAIQGIFKTFDPENPFTYTFADQQYAEKFHDEERIGRIAGFFTILAIFISCLGLLGLSAFMAEQRARELGIRKVLGASVFNLWNLLSKEFVRLVTLSLLIGAPIGYWLMHGWLNNYGYHTGLSWWIFAVTAAGAIGITIITVSFQSIKAALTNPVKSLKTE